MQNIPPPDIYCKGKNGNFTVEEASRYHLNQLIKVNITSNKYRHHLSPDMIYREGQICVLSFPIMQNFEKALDKPKLGFLQNNRLLLLKSIKVINKERLRYCHKLQEIKETCQLIKFGIVYQILKQKKGITGKTQEIQIMSVIQLI